MEPVYSSETGQDIVTCVEYEYSKQLMWGSHAADYEYCLLRCDIA
jgi:hypothetical protein